MRPAPLPTSPSLPPPPGRTPRRGRAAAQIAIRVIIGGESAAEAATAAARPCRSAASQVARGKSRGLAPQQGDRYPPAARRAANAEYTAVTTPQLPPAQHPPLHAQRRVALAAAAPRPAADDAVAAAVPWPLAPSRPRRRQNHPCRLRRLLRGRGGSGGGCAACHRREGPQAAAAANAAVADDAAVVLTGPQQRQPLQNTSHSRRRRQRRRATKKPPSRPAILPPTRTDAQLLPPPRLASPPTTPWLASPPCRTPRRRATSVPPRGWGGGGRAACRQRGKAHPLAAGKAAGADVAAVAVPGVRLRRWPQNTNH